MSSKNNTAVTARTADGRAMRVWSANVGQAFGCVGVIAHTNGRRVTTTSVAPYGMQHIAIDRAVALVERSTLTELIAREAVR